MLSQTVTAGGHTVSPEMVQLFDRRLKEQRRLVRRQPVAPQLSDRDLLVRGSVQRMLADACEDDKLKKKELVVYLAARGLRVTEIIATLRGVDVTVTRQLRCTENERHPVVVVERELPARYNPFAVPTSA